MIDTEKYGPWALIAGGSEGVGASLGHTLTAIGMNLVLLARRPEPLEALAQELRADNKAEVRTLAVDLKQPDVLDRIRSVTDDLEIGLLIFNAGEVGSVMGSFVDRDLNDVLAVVQVSVTAQTTLAHHFGARMAARGRGGIILMGSLSGNVGMPNQVAYCAAKAYTQILAEGLWCELTPRGVDVIAPLLGVIDTPARTRAGLPSPSGLPVFAADTVAQEVLDNLPGGGPVFVSPAMAQVFQYFSSTPRRQLAERMRGVTVA